MLLAGPLTMPHESQVLPSQPTLAIGDVDEAHVTISELFCEHRLAPVAGGGVRMRLRSIHDQGVGLEMLDYGEAVRISPVGLETFHLVQIPLSGRARMRVGEETVESSPAVATVPPTDEDFSMVWERETPHLIVYVQRDKLLAALQCCYGSSDPDGWRPGPALTLDDEAGRLFLRAVFELHDTLEQATAAAGYARALAAELVLARLLGALEQTPDGAPPARATPVERRHGRGDRLYRRFLEQVQTAAAVQRSVLQIAQDLQVPLRTLQDHVHAASGRTPSAILRDARFRHAHQLLSDGDPSRDTVTAIAGRTGFGHLGRFSMEYRARYGESPGDALRR